ncbi:cobalamin-binding protein [Hyphomicrobium methylovorum]|uniref:cobalamin-binding protein n=1 Tax=Hyphomicrobium methylovorum TaxID=84 RepID=UPI0015E680C5|nr:cobalamin-binding protein [Hyphomicrobium methylovorum]MBA2124723.1 cobalamin-binding protein [Hyphomicrobium methylovorum]
MRTYPPRRLVCLTEETVETLYLLGEQDRIVGVSGYAVRPPQVRREKPRVSAFTSADISKITALEPDLVLAFSDIQADIVASLARAGLAVHVFNQRDLAGVFAMIRTLGALIAEPGKAEDLARTLEARIETIAAETSRATPRPRVYFEEWNEPIITGLGWVSELIEVAGGDDIFPEKRSEAAARDRVVTADDVAARKPDIILASWCGKKVRPDTIRSRPGWENVPAITNNHIYEIKSPLILQPGPAAITDGLDAIRSAMARWASSS